MTAPATKPLKPPTSPEAHKDSRTQPESPQAALQRTWETYVWAAREVLKEFREGTNENL